MMQLRSIYDKTGDHFFVLNFFQNHKQMKIIFGFFYLIDKKICNFTIGKNLVKLGCYRDGQEVPRPLPVLLFDDEGSAEHKGNWVAYTNAIVCKCATETEKRGWYTFGIQNYGKLFYTSEQ